MAEYLDTFDETVDGKRVARESWAGSKYIELHTPTEGDPYIRLVDAATGEPIDWPQEQIDIDTAPEITDWFSFDPGGE